MRRTAPIVQMGLRDSEDAGELGIVGGHELGLGGLLANGCQTLDVFHAPEGLLPQLQLACHLQMSSFEFQLKHSICKTVKMQVSLA